MERLFKAYFTEGRHVGRIEELAALAEEIGLDGAAVAEALESHRFVKAVRDDQRTAAEYGISGVPFFVIDGTYGVSGAQEAQTFAQVLEQVWTERSETRQGVGA
jgi:predicted DsbA family dithiol-disulfide isomerase